MAKKYNERIFWDVDFNALDDTIDADFIIIRIFSRGDVPDIRSCRRHYGDQKIRDVLLQVKHLPLPRLYLASAIVNRPITAFRCYEQRQYLKNSLPY